MNIAVEIQTDASITMTEAARRHVKQQLEKRGSGIGLRLGVTRNGCSGFGYVVDFVDEAGAADQVYDVGDGVAVVVDGESLPMVKGTQVDFVRNGLNATFEFRNPNVTAACGCGESFSV